MIEDDRYGSQEARGYFTLCPDSLLVLPLAPQVPNQRWIKVNSRVVELCLKFGGLCLVVESTISIVLAYILLTMICGGGKM